MVTTLRTALHVSTAGTGPPVLLLHGWPHTHRVWDLVVPGLTRAGFTTLAPDQRGIGASPAPDDRYDGLTLAGDLVALLDTLGHVRADVVALDAGVPPALLLALIHPDRVRRLVVMEALPYPTDGPTPWWFGFHAAPGDLAATVLEGHEAEYIDFFLRAGTHGGVGVPPAQREAFVAAHTGREALGRSFGTYRAMAETQHQLVAAGRLPTPTLALGADVVGDALRRRLLPVADALEGAILPNCGHIVPLDAPETLLSHLLAFLPP